MALADHKLHLYWCTSCGGCRVGTDDWGYDALGRPICPSGERFVFDSYYASGRTMIARRLLEGRLPWSENLVRRYYTCTQCGACDENCYEETGRHPLKVIQEVQRELVNRGIGPHPALSHRRYAQFFDAYEERVEKAAKAISNKARLMYFVGCTLECYDRGLIECTRKLLSAVGDDFVIAEQRWCCGYPLLDTGQVEKAKRIAEINVASIKGTNVEKVIFSCPICYRIFKFQYPEILGSKLDLEVVHTTELFLNAIVKGQLRPRINIARKVFYHDPCNLGRRGPKIYDQPREILYRISGIRLIELPGRTGNAWCCGAGGMVKRTYPDLAVWTATKRVKELEEAGINTVVTACPVGEGNFADAAKAADMKIDVFDINEVLADSLELG
jgi:Fe-S oxidoreductase